MKNISLSINRILIVLGLVAGVFFLLGHYLPPWFNEVSGRNARTATPFYHHMVGIHSAGDELQPDDLIVFLGDSLTQSLPVASVTPVGLNYGIGTDTSKGLLERLPSYSSLNQAQAIVLAIGTNDLQIDVPSVVLGRYRQILNELPEKPEIICSAILPVKVSAMEYPGSITQQKIIELNSDIKKLCETRNHTFSAVPTTLMDDKGELDAPYHDGDGVHLNSAGYSIWVRHLQEQLKVLGLPVDTSNNETAQGSTQ